MGSSSLAGDRVRFAEMDERLQSPLHYEFPSISGPLSTSRYSGTTYRFDSFSRYSSVHRATGGLLDDKAGRLAQLDALAEEFCNESTAAHQTLKEVSDLAATLGAGAKHFLRVMEKVVNGSALLVEELDECVLGMPAVVVNWRICVEESAE